MGLLRNLVISRVISPLIWVICIVTLLLTLLITTHEPPSKGPCSQIVYTLAPKYLYRDYFKANVYTI